MMDISIVSTEFCIRVGALFILGALYCFVLQRARSAVRKGRPKSKAIEMLLARQCILIMFASSWIPRTDGVSLPVFSTFERPKYLEQMSPEHTLRLFQTYNDAIIRLSLVSERQDFELTLRLLIIGMTTFGSFWQVVRWTSIGNANEASALGVKVR
jgi:hypothetical protein